MTELKSDVKEMRLDVAHIKTRLDSHGRRFDALDQKFDSLDQRVGNLEKTVSRIAVTVTHLKEDVSNMVTRAEFKAAVDTILTRFDGFATILEDMRFRWAIQSSTLADHGMRIQKIEGRLQ